MNKHLILLFLILLIVTPVLVSAGALNISSYYVSPFGNYDYIKIQPEDISTFICDDSLEGALAYNIADDNLYSCRGNGTPFWDNSFTFIWDSVPYTVSDPTFVFLKDNNPNAFLGIGTSEPDLKLTITDDAGIIAATDENYFTVGTLPDLITSGAGTRLIWYPKKVAFRAGSVNLNQWNNVNIGNGSIALGKDVLASGDNSIAIGDGISVVASNSAAISLSDQSSIIINRSNVFVIMGGDVGINNVDPDMKLSISGGILATSDKLPAQLPILTTIGPGVRMIWYPKKSALLAGKAVGSEWDDANIGLSVIALGENVSAGSTGSIAIGKDITASAQYSLGIGSSINSKGSSSTVIGFINSGMNNNVIVGFNSISRQSNSVSVGNSNLLPITETVAIGSNNSTGRIGDVSIGLNNTVNGIGTYPGIAVGSNIYSKGESPIVIGYDSTVNATANPAFRGIVSVGENNSLIQEATIAIGKNNTNSSNYELTNTVGTDNTNNAFYGAVIIGRKNETLINARGSVTIGSENTTKYDYEFSVGVGNINSGYASVVVGQYNSLEAGAAWSAAVGENNTVRSTNFKSFVMGNNNVVDELNSIVIGQNSIVSGVNSLAIGNGVSAKTLSAVALGNYNLVLGSNTTNSFNVTDPIFSIGNGTDSANRSNAITILKSGNVGIGTTNPAMTLYVNGTAGGTGNFLVESDKRLKKNIMKIKDPIEKINKIQAVSFDWKDKEQYGNNRNIGFIAQDIKEILPEIVNKPNDYYSLEYGPVVALLIEAIKEIDLEKQQLQLETDSLRNQINEYLKSVERK